MAYIFPLVFLCKLVNEVSRTRLVLERSLTPLPSQGLLTADLVLLHSPTNQQPWLYTQKLPRLLELGASFLDAIALNADHPARSQAQVLRALLDSGVKGVGPSSPQLPRHAATVMSPSASTAPALFAPPTAPAGTSTLGQQQQAWQASNMGPPGVSLGNSSPALMQFQQQQQQLSQQQQASTEALTNVLDNFDPMFGESGGNFWEWGGLGGSGPGGEVDWATQPFR